MSTHGFDTELGLSLLAIDNPFPDSCSYYIPVCDSTMDVARQASSTRPYGLVRAGAQTAGRGRLPGRVWQSTTDESLLVTMWFQSLVFGQAPPPLLAGLAIKRACESWAASVGVALKRGLSLKWPNDLLCADRKIAGILCEAAGPIIFVGIGINCLQDQFPQGFNTIPSSLYLETGKKPDLDALTSHLAKAFYSLLRAHTKNPHQWKDEYESLMAWRSERVRFIPGIDEEEVRGILHGVDSSGALVLSKDGMPPGHPDTVTFASGELRRY